LNESLEYGIIRTQLEKNGTPIGPMDTLIAAHAISIQATLVTNNLREFNRVKGLKLENWT
jgi:tRNA(fMet)-specific endonuclease VapC